MSRFILTYHSISDRDSAITVSPPRFEAQIEELLDAGYRFETVSSIIERRDDRRRVAICFDDGFESVATIALPVLANEGLPATVFPIVSGIGRRADWRSRTRRLNDEPMLDITALGDLVGSGWEVGSHGMSHRCLLELGAERAGRELADSKAFLESHLGTRVTGFAHPQGCWSRVTVGVVKQSGFAWACSTLPVSRTLVWNRWLLPRVTVGPSTSALRFRAARFSLSRALRAIVPGPDSILHSGHRHGHERDASTFVERS